MYRPYQNGSQQQAQSMHLLETSWFPTLLPGMGVTPPGASLDAAMSQSSEFRSHPPVSPLLSQNATASATVTFLALKNKSMEELQRLLSNQDAYSAFLHSSDSFRQIDMLWSELLKNNVELARHNLEKESEISEIRNQCTIIRTTELAAAQEKIAEVQKRENEINAVYAPAALLKRLQGEASKLDDESENLYHKLLSGEINLAEFIQSYRKKRFFYHKCILTRLAARTSMATPG